MEFKPVVPVGEENRQFNILTITAERNEDLQPLAKEYVNYLSTSQNKIEDICFTANINSTLSNHRLVIVGKSPEDFIKKLTGYCEGREQAGCFSSGSQTGDNGKIAFLFTGQGSQYVGMAKALYRSVPVFKEQMDRCDELFSRYIDTSLTRLLYGDNTNEEELSQAIYAQPIIFSTGYSLCKLWESWGIAPSAVIGHSIGEYAAAAAAGVFTLEDAVNLVAARGKLMQQVPGNGKMVGVLMSETEARELVSRYKDSVSIAAVNSPQNVTLSGSSAALEKIIHEVQESRFFVEHLNISHPFHSIQMEPYIEKFRKEIGPITFSKPQISVISTITGNPVQDEMCCADYWCTHISRTVRFYDAVKAAEEQGIRLFVEIGGTATLSGLAADCVTGENGAFAFLPSLRKGNNAWKQLCNSLAQLHSRGINIDWQQFNQPFNRKNIPLSIEPPGPGYSRAQPAPGMDRHVTYKTNIKKEKMMESKQKGEEFEEIQYMLKNMIEVISGLDPNDIEDDTSFFSLGLDSLMLVQFRKKINDKYNIDISLNDFLTKYTTVEKINHFLVKQIPAKALGPGKVSIPTGPETRPAKPRGQKNMPAPGSSGGSDIERVIVEQLEVMKLQNQKMSEIMEKQLLVLKEAPGSTLKTGEETRPLNKQPMPHFQVMKLEEDDFSPAQNGFIKEFIARYTARTRKSKAYARANRRVLSDWVSSYNFRLSLKEIVYPIVSQRSAGARFWDIDGNEYIDIAIGYGVNYFGHKPGFIEEALEKQIKEGIEMATQSDLAGEVARMISRLANVERVVFSNTGTEAVMAALRIARAVTGRKKFVRFAGAFHGTFDPILAEADEYGTYPLAPGTPPGMVEDTIVLIYGSPESLEKIEEMGEELAAVLVEPVQSRKPAFRPRQFLHQLREITSRTGAALIFDDIFMGFRIHQGGSQAYFDVEADIVTFGKIIGGGIPIGVVAGKTKFMDAIDGGYWDYGDASVPAASRTVYGGTFCRHPLALAAAHAVLTYLEEQGPGLQEKVNQRLETLAHQVNAFCEAEDVPMRVRQGGGSFRFESFGIYDQSLLPIEMELFYYLLIEKGVYLWERRICALSTAHSDEDVQAIVKAVKDSVEEIRQGGFTFSGAAARDNLEKQQDDFSLTPAQKRYFILNQIKELEKAVHLSFAMTVTGNLDIKKLESAMHRLIQRHDIFRLSFEIKEGEIVQEVRDIADVESAILHKKVSADKIDEAIEDVIQPFDLASPPLLRMGVLELADDRFLLVMDSHHIAMDGDSANIIVREFMQFYQGKNLPPAEMRYRDYITWWQSYLTSDDFKTKEQFWVKQFSGQLPRLDLPLDFPRSAKRNFAGAQVKFRVEKDTTDALKQLAKASNATLFIILLESYFIWLHKLSGQEDIIVGVPLSIREEKGFQDIVGYFTNNLVIRSKPTANKSFGALLNETRANWIEAYLHKEYPYEFLVENIAVTGDISRNPLFDAMFIYENVNERVLKIEDLTCSLYYFDTKVSLFDITMEAFEKDDYLDIKIFYSTALFKKETIETWGGYFKQLLEDILSNREDIVIGDILKELKNRKKAALLPKEAGQSSTPHHRPAANKIEKELIEIWKRELNIPKVEPGDNFFQLGGRSLDTIRVVSSINSQLGANISLAAMFQYPTVSELARQVETPSQPQPAASRPDIPPAPPQPAYDLSHEQMRYWLIAQVNSTGKDAVQASGVEITADAFIFEGTLQLNRLKEALARVVKRHDILRTAYEEQEGKPVQIIGQYTDKDIPIQYCDLSAYPPDQQQEQLSLRILEEHQREFNLKTWPLIRFFLYKINDTKHILFGNAPHISFDGWSFSIILAEAAHFYSILKTGKNTSPLPPVMRYVDYVQWHEKRIKSGELEQQANYWTRYLTEKIPVALLPYDYQEEGAATDLEPSRIFRFKLNPQLTSKLQEMAAKENTTLFVTTLAVLKTWLAIMTNQNVITVGTIFSGRTYPELEKIPGIMMNLLPVRLNLSGNPDCREILLQTKQVVLDAYNNQDYPMDLVAHKMRKVINLNRDIYSIMFIGQEALTGNVHFEGLKTGTCPLLNLIYGRHDKDDIFVHHDYNLQQDLLIEMLEENDQIKFIVRYNRRKFRSETIKQYFNHFKSIAGQFLNSPDLHLSQLQSLKICELDELF